MRGLWVGLVALPLLGSACLATAARRMPLVARQVALAASGMAALCTAALLLFAAEGPAGLAWTWLPGTGQMSLAFGTTGLYAALFTAGGAFLVFLSAFSGGAPPGSEQGRLAWSAAVTLVALAAASVAFLSGHFLLRYAALEIVALCVALAPLVELHGASGRYRRPQGTGSGRPGSSGARLAQTVYLVLRLGDAGLLAAILILMEATGTLDIAAALEAGQAMEAARLRWAVAGLGLAAWVKVGGWPLHVWTRAGRSLSPPAQFWLYATLMPNLGVYLLYRTAPLLALAGPWREVVLWGGGLGVLLATLCALAQPDALEGWRAWLGAALGGMALFAAASGLGPVVWLGLLVVTPVRLLSLLAASAGRRRAVPARRAAAGFMALGGLALVAWCALTAWWAREGGGSSPGALLVVEAAVVLMGVWVARAARQLFVGERGWMQPEPLPWAWWAAVSVLGAGVAAGGLAFRPLYGALAAAGHIALPALPAPLALLRDVVTSPATLAAAVLVLAVRIVVRGRASLQYLWKTLRVWSETLRVWDAPQMIEVVEIDVLGQVVNLFVQGVLGGARLVRRVVEEQLLEGSVYQIGRMAIAGGHWAYRIIEQEGLEGLLRRAVRALFAFSRGMQRWHAGRLRRNLVWVVMALALALLIGITCGW